jgi:hypothetical protein
MREEDVDGDESWFQLHYLSPTAAVGVDLNGDGTSETVVCDFPGQGLWLFDGASGPSGEWRGLHPLDVSHMVAANLDGFAGDELIVNFPGYGLWVYGSGSWSSLTSSDVSAMSVADLDANGSKDLIVNFPGDGVWSYRYTMGWSLNHPYAANRLAAGDLDRNGLTDLVIDFGASFGVWLFRNGTTWAPLHGLTTEGIVVGDVNGNGYAEVMCDFGPLGLWSYEDVSGWQLVHGFDPRLMVMGYY